VKQADGDVIILVDVGAVRHDVREEVSELVKKTGFPVYSAPMGKATVSEKAERYGGVSSRTFSIIPFLTDCWQIYVGSISHPDIKDKVESAKLIISIGSLRSDFNTGNFTYRIPTSRTIEVSSLHWSYIYNNLLLQPAPCHPHQRPICTLPWYWHEASAPETHRSPSSLPRRRPHD
jgi:pyruvate decarboxylase